MENLKLATFRSQLIQIITNNELSLGTTYYILKDVVSQIEELYQETLQKEYQDYIKKQNQKQKKEEIKPEDIANAAKGALVDWKEQDNQG